MSDYVICYVRPTGTPELIEAFKDRMKAEVESSGSPDWTFADLGEFPRAPEPHKIEWWSTWCAKNNERTGRWLECGGRNYFAAENDVCLAAEYFNGQPLKLEIDVHYEQGSCYTREIDCLTRTATHYRPVGWAGAGDRATMTITEIAKGHLKALRYQRGRDWVDNAVIRPWLHHRLSTPCGRNHIQYRWWLQEIDGSTSTVETPGGGMLRTPAALVLVSLKLFPRLPIIVTGMAHSAKNLLMSPRDLPMEGYVSRSSRVGCKSRWLASAAVLTRLASRTNYFVRPSWQF